MLPSLSMLFAYSPLNKHRDPCSVIGIAMLRGEGILSPVCKVTHSDTCRIEKAVLIRRGDGGVKLYLK